MSNKLGLPLAKKLLMTSSASGCSSLSLVLIRLAVGRAWSSARFKYKSIMSFGITVSLVFRLGFESILRMLNSPVSNIEDKRRFWRPRAVIAVRVPLKDWGWRFWPGFHVESFTRRRWRWPAVLVVSKATDARIEKRRTKMRRGRVRRGKLIDAITSRSYLFGSIRASMGQPVLYPINSVLIRSPAERNQREDAQLSVSLRQQLQQQQSAILCISVSLALQFGF